MLALSHNGKERVEESPKTSKRILSQYLLPVEEYRIPIIIKPLDNRGGIAIRKAVLSGAFGELEAHLKPHDLATLNGGPSRWHNRIELVKSPTQKEGFIESVR